MLRPDLTPIAPPAPLHPLPAQFKVLVWNVHKLPFTRLNQCLPQHLYDLCLLQEAVLSTHTATHPRHPWAMSPNLQHRQRYYGVLTSSRFGLRPMHQHLSRRRELRLFTHKSALLTQHILADGQPLRVLNLHLLLTAPRRTLYRELSLLAERVADYRGPLIIAGDFNSWSRPRLKLLQQWAERLSLHWPTPQQAHHVRHHRQRPLDHLLYRGLELAAFYALDVPCSDHNPLVAHFSRPPQAQPLP